MILTFTILKITVLVRGVLNKLNAILNYNIELQYRITIKLNGIKYNNVYI
jgi:hypothetical protein